MLDPVSLGITALGVGSQMFGSRGPSAKDIRRRGRYVLSNILEPGDRLAFGDAEKEARGAVDEVRAGVKEAKQTVGNSFRGAMRSAIDQGKQAQGDALQRLSSRGGLSRTGSLAANLRIGVGMNTARAISDVQDRIAQIGAGLATQGGEAVGAARSRLSSFLMQRGLADRERNMLHWQLLTGMQPSNQKQGIDLGGLGQLLGALNNSGDSK